MKLRNKFAYLKKVFRLDTFATILNLATGRNHFFSLIEKHAFKIC